MGLEAATYLNGLNSSNPAAGDALSQGDDHIRLIKAVLLATFPNLSAAVTPTATELNYVDGVTSAIQTQLDALVASVALKLALSGGTMTGNIVLAGAPTVDLHPATKKYVDDADALLLPKAGGTMTGALVLAGAPDADLKAATKKYVDDTVAAATPAVSVLARATVVGPSNGAEATYTRVGTTVSVSWTGHPFIVGSVVSINSATDTGLNGLDVTVTNIGTNTFTFEANVSGANGSFSIYGAVLNGTNVASFKMITANIFDLEFETELSTDKYSVIHTYYYSPALYEANNVFKDEGVTKYRTTTKARIPMNNYTYSTTHFDVIVAA